MPSAPPEGLLKDMRVLVTGGSGSLGRGIALASAKAGARVAFTWNTNEHGAQETGGLLGKLGCEFRAIRSRLDTKGEAESVAREVVQAWGGIDALVNNAGMSEAMPFVLMSEDDMRRVLDANFMTAFRMTQGVLRGMIRQKFGRIVNISSIVASRSIPGPAHYAVSKAAIEGLTRSLSQEVGRYNVLVNAIAAGIFEGGLKATIPDHHQKRYIDACALNRLGHPEECGALAVWLMSPANSYQNGTVTILDGGTVA